MCKWEGLLLARLHRRLQAACHQSMKDIGDLASKTSLLGGFLVLRIRSRPVDAPAACCQQQGGGLGGHPDSGAHIGIESVWVHISAMCLSPWRPTCLIMDRCAAFDRNGLVGFRVARDSNDESVLSWRTMWEVVAALQLRKEHVLSRYRLTALPQTTFELDPSRQSQCAWPSGAACVAGQRARAIEEGWPAAAADADSKVRFARCRSQHAFSRARRHRQHRFCQR